MYPVQIRPEGGIRRGHLQAHLESKGVDTRMVWTGNAARQPAFRDEAMRIDVGGLANADRVIVITSYSIHYTKLYENDK